MLTNTSPSGSQLPKLLNPHRRLRRENLSSPALMRPASPPPHPMADTVASIPTARRFLMATTPEQYDAIIIGSGEAGKWMAWHLGSQGQRVINIEDKRIGGACP